MEKKFHVESKIFSLIFMGKILMGVIRLVNVNGLDALLVINHRILDDFLWLLFLKVFFLMTVVFGKLN